MAITSKLGTIDAVLAVGMTAGFIPDDTVEETVTSAMSMGHVVQFTVDPVVVQVMSISDVATFVSVPSPPKIPLVIESGKVKQSQEALDLGIEFTRFLTLDHTTTINDKVIVCEAAITVTLIDAATFVKRRVEIKNIFAGTVTIETNASELIDNLSSATLAQWDSVTLFSTGTGWIIL